MRGLILTGMMPVAFPTKSCKSCSFAIEAEALQKDLQSKNWIRHSLLCRMFAAFILPELTGYVFSICAICYILPHKTPLLP